MKPGLAIMMMVISACYSTRNNGYRRSADFDKQIKAANISFFGKFRFETSPLPKKGNNLFILFKNDSLKAISSGNQKPQLKKSLFNVLYVTDSMTILTAESLYKYLTVDTMVFFGKRCLKKRIYYEYSNNAENTRVPALTEFYQYDFTPGQLLVASKRFHTEETIGLVNIFDKYPDYDAGRMKAKLDLKMTGQLREGYTDEDRAKLQFFQRYIL